MKKFFSTIIIFFLFVFSINAQEGMWLLNQIDKLDLNKKGLQIDVSDVYNPDKPSLYNAVIQLGGGTGSFVSPDGLILTNHHVAYTGLQRASSKENDYITNGFLARNRSDEIPALGYQARLLVEMKDVTSQVLDAVKGVTDVGERSDKITKKTTEITEAVTKGNDDLSAIVNDLYEGGQYMLFIYKTIKDIRIVYAPPLSIGNYGGEVDNWMWPRHTGDFTYMRAYVSPDGKCNEYSPNNVPFKPKIWLKIAKDFLKEGDFTFALGFPGFTTRYRSSNSVSWNLNENYPFSIKNYKEIITLLEETTKNSPEGKIKVANQIKGLANAMKNFQGKVDGMKKTNFLQKKYDFENEFMKWVNSDASRKSKYVDILNKEKNLYTDLLEKTKKRDNIFGIFQGLASTQLIAASRIYGIGVQVVKPENERLPGYSDKNIERFKNNVQYNYLNYFEASDKALLVRALKMANELPEGQRIIGLEYIFNDKSQTIEQFVDNTFKNSKLNDVEYAKNLIGKSVKELEALNDPFFKMAASMYPESEEIRINYQNFSDNVTYLRKFYAEALYEWKGKGLYPDANGTLRFSCGNVKGYAPVDAVWYYPFTTLKGVIAKNTGEEPFDTPQELINIYNSKDFGKWVSPTVKDVPVAFTHQCDNTGGSSGSPVMNAKGELIGLLFDGNYEAMISDWQYDYDLQRAISVDIHYVMFITEKFAKAGFLLDEMGVKN
ncbi:MAG: S46 family peptidase [Ignavibacteriae bacterium]|nr:S46 family peptidase [Ignavibacteriota bacterium]